MFLGLGSFIHLFIIYGNFSSNHEVKFRFKIEFLCFNHFILSSYIVLCRAPLFVGVNKLGSANVVDLSLQEQACCRAALWIAVSPMISLEEQVSIFAYVHQYL